MNDSSDERCLPADSIARPAILKQVNPLNNKIKTVFVFVNSRDFCLQWSRRSLVVAVDYFVGLLGLGLRFKPHHETSPTKRHVK